jgi:hypothetical protein
MPEQSLEGTQDRAPLIHIGYHKTGSTWLQEVLFSDPTLQFELLFERPEVNDRLVAPKQAAFDAAAEGAFFAMGIRDCGDRVPVLSNERFSGNPHSGGWDSRILADRLALLFSGARVLIVIREQQSALRSVYLQYVREGGSESLRGYLAPPIAGQFRRPMFDFDFFAYHDLIDYYQQAFGRDHVLVLPYEMLRADPLGFAARVCGFCGVASPSAISERRANVGMSPFAAALKRPLNRLFVRDSLNPAAPFAFARANDRIRVALEALDRLLPNSAKEAGHDKMRRQIAEATGGDRYRESNAHTAEATGLDLAAYGYAL